MDIAIAIYSRISTDKQDNQNQLDQLRSFAASQGWKIKREYVDVATGIHLFDLRCACSLALAEASQRRRRG